MRARGTFSLATKEKEVMQFQKGQSGNPAGRPRGSRNKTTVLMQNLLDGEAEEIARKAIEMAKAGYGCDPCVHGPSRIDPQIRIRPPSSFRRWTRRGTA
jgi:hypothetical protein